MMHECLAFLAFIVTVFICIGYFVYKIIDDERARVIVLFMTIMLCIAVISGMSGIILSCY